MGRVGPLIAMLFAWARVAQAYIAVPANRLTLPEVMLEFPTVVVMSVEKCDAARGAFLFRLVETLQGEAPRTPVRHALLQDGQLSARLAGLKRGDLVVSFQGSPDRRSLTLTETGWYLTVPDQDWERFTGFRDDFASMFVGSPRELANAVRQLRYGSAVNVKIAPSGFPKDTTATIRFDPAFPHLRWLVASEKPRNLSPEQYLERLRDKHPQVRCEAALEGGVVGKPSSAGIRALLRLLKDENATVRLAAVTALAGPKEAAAEIVPRLTEALRDEDRFVCAFAARSLANFGTAAKSALPDLVAALADRNADYDFRPHRAAEAAQAILKIAPQSTQASLAIEFFLAGRMLNDERRDSEGTRAAAARALGRCGAAAKPAVPELVKRCRDSDPATRIAAAEATLLISTENQDVTTAHDVLVAELKSMDDAIVVQTLRAIAATRRTQLLPKVRLLVHDQRHEIQKVADECVRQLER